jgi:DNA-binding LacI/PurR family transcriptional regulator
MVHRIRDVAKRAGVSPATISRVLNRARYVAPETRRRVLEVARELNFYGNEHARRLAQKRSNLYGLIISEIANPFFPEIIRGFESAALGKGLDVLLCNTEYGPDRFEAAVRKLIANQVRGVAVMTSMIDRALAEELARLRIPVVLLDQGPPGKLISTIRINYLSGVTQALKHLRELGHRDFCFVSGPQTIRSAAAYRQAYVQAAEELGLKNPAILEGNHKVEGGVAAARLIGEGSRMPTAILCGNDMTAIGVMSGLEELGLGVPRDVSVVGFDDVFFAQLAHPPLTTIHLAREGLGQLALELLEKTPRLKGRIGVEHSFETELVVRKSTGAVRDQRAAEAT